MHLMSSHAPEATGEGTPFNAAAVMAVGSNAPAQALGYPFRDIMTVVVWAAGNQLAS